MNLQSRIDTRMDVFFMKKGKYFFQLHLLLIALVIPMTIFYIVRFGTSQLGPESWQIKIPVLPLMVFLIIFEAFFQRYSRRLQRKSLTTVSLAYLTGCLLSLLVIFLTMPGLPLNKYWHAPTGGIIFLLPLSLLFYGLSYTMYLYDSKGQISKAFK